MDSLAPKQQFLASLDRCTQSADFLTEFYEHFINSSQEVRIHFAGTNIEKQSQMLRRSLQLTAAATTGDATGLRELRARAESHDRDHLNVRPKLYELWRVSLIETARRFDDAWDHDVEDAWNRILGYVINHMTRHY